MNELQCIGNRATAHIPEYTACGRMKPSVKKTSIETSLLWPDVIRIFAVIGVVTIHSFSLPSLGSDWRSFEVLFNWFWFIGIKTCVPLFLLLSGALLLGKKEPQMVFYSKRLSRILLPWLVWGVVFLITKHQEHLTSIPHALKTFTQILSAEFSFLPVLVCLYLLMPFMKVLVSELAVMKRWQLIGLWFLGISLLPYLRNTMAFPIAVDNGLVRQTINYIGFIFLGHELRLWLEAQKQHRQVLLKALIAFCLSVAGTFFIQFTHPSTPQLFLSYVAPLIILSSTAAFCALFAAAKMNQSPQFQKTLHEYSAASFGVFFLHPLVLMLVTPGILTQDITLKNILLTTITIGLSFLVILSLQQIPWLRKKIS